MRGAVMHGPGDVRIEERGDPGIDALEWPAPMGHEYVGIVEEVGEEVRAVTPGQFVVGSFWASDNTCEICRAG